MFLILDNYDSFVHNLARYFTRTGEACKVVRNDQITIAQIQSMAPRAIVISPGPCTPQDSGICIEVVKTFGATTPIFGVCLGHQAIAEAYGGKTVQSPTPIHGQSSLITHNRIGVFQGLNTPLEVGRYHSLMTTLDAQSPLSITARLADDTIMAVQHKTHPVFGVQFHPESILTQNGAQMVQNFVTFARDWHAKTGKDAA